VGLDFVEITLRIEDEFGVELSQDDLTEIAHDRDIVVGDLYKLLLKKIHSRDVARYDISVNLALWREVRELIRAAADVPPEQVELRTPLETLFPRETRRAGWEALRKASPYRIRKLDYPRAVEWIGLALALGMVLMEQFQIWQVPGVAWLWPFLGLLGVWMLVETYIKVLWILAPLRNRFPSGMTTVKDLCRAVVAANHEHISGADDIPADDRCLAVWRQLTEILVDVLGVDAERVTFDARLVRDLAMA
jgi:acyl carrier protein